MAAHVWNERLRRRNQALIARRPRVFRDRSNPLEDLEPSQVFERYRFFPGTIMFLLSLLPNLSAPTRRNHPLPPTLQLLTCLRYLATGSTQLLIADSVRISRSTAGRCIRRVAKLISKLAPRFVVFPRGNQAGKTKVEFSKVAGFPDVLGCIDGTHIRIQRPNENEGDFVNRKGYHSLNVQAQAPSEIKREVVREIKIYVDQIFNQLSENRHKKMCCDSKFRITSCNASWPGSVHDSRILRSSALCQQFENGDHAGFLLGDSGYPCRHFLLTPFINPTTEPEIAYNTALCRTRVLIEQTFGILKRRFQVLHFEMITAPKLFVINIIACVVLHNIGIVRGDIIRNEDDFKLDNERP